MGRRSRWEQGHCGEKGGQEGRVSKLPLCILLKINLIIKSIRKKNPTAQCRSIPLSHRAVPGQRGFPGLEGLGEGRGCPAVACAHGSC